jgi:hypothetical protein
MLAADDVIQTYDAELGPEPRRSNRGFWIVAGALAVGGIFLIVEIFANRPLANSIGHAQATLRRAQGAAEIIRDRSGGFGGADAESLTEHVPTLAFRRGDEPSFGNDVVSVSASETVWAAAVEARPGACFYLRLEVGSDTRYGAGTECTGDAALSAADPRW